MLISTATASRDKPAYVASVDIQTASARSKRQVPTPTVTTKDMRSASKSGASGYAEAPASTAQAVDAVGEGIDERE